jgi:4-amino-4-deoxy-L-arabinose transferase-like glycosyltransferase
MSAASSAAGRHRPLPPRLVLTIVALALALFAGRLVHTATQKSITADEVAYVGTALYLWESGDYHYATALRFHPPLTFHLAGILLPWLDLEGRTPSPTLGEEILQGGGPSPHTFRLLSRLPFIAMACWGALLCFLWAREAGGTHAGLLALFLFTFSPTILASAHLAHTDITIGVLYLQTLYAFWRWWKRPTPLRYALCGLSLGIALAGKLSAIPLAAEVALLHLWTASGFPPFGVRDGAPAFARRLGSAAAHYAGWIAMSVAIVWCSYGGSFAWAVAEAGPLAGYTLPAYVQNFFFDIEANVRGRPIFLAGAYDDQGWWYLLWVSFLLKTPIGILAMLALALVSRKSLPGGVAPFLCLPFLVYGTIVTFVLRIHLGLRYLMPILPMIHIFIALKLVPLESRWRRYVVGAACLWVAGASLWIHPHYLSYFNESIGGPSNGYHYLAESNIDWGQDLPALARYLSDRGNPPVWLAYFGTENPEVHGIRAVALPGCEPVTGLVAISVNVLRRLYSAENIFQRPPEGCYDWLLEREPVAQPGYSIMVYEIPDS